jgi:hypothetical protein
MVKGEFMRQILIALPFIILSGIALSMNAGITEESASPEVFLNHFLLVIDASTYKDIVESDFIKNEFAHFEERTTVVNNNASYSGAYVYGDNTYFEFFDGSKSQDSATSGITSAIGFGVEKKDELKIIQKKLKDYKNAFYALRTREFEGAQIPWFFSTGVFYGQMAPDITTWVMEYHEDFLKKWHPEIFPSSPGIMRKDILKRYAAKIAIPEELRDKIFKDVTEIYLRLNQKDFEIFKEELSVFGYESFTKDGKKICTGPDIKFIVDIFDEGTGQITGIRMSCRPNPYMEKTFEFGKKSHLNIHSDNTATWLF